MSARSIRRTLVGRLLLVLIAAAIALNGALYVVLRHELIEQYDDALQTEARAIGSIWQPDADADRQATRIAQTFSHLRFGRDDGDVLRIVRRDESTALRVPPASPGQRELALPADAPPAVGHRRTYDVALPDGRAGRAAEIAGDGYSVILAEGRAELNETLATLSLGLITIGGGLSAASIAIVVTIVGRALRPLHAFSESVGRLDAGSLAYRFPVEQLPDELRPISARLNDLLARLDESFGRERRFSDNVAHELRTPLAELRSMVEVAIRWPPEPDAFAPHHAALLEVVKRMSSVVQTLLMLVRSDPARLVAAVASVDLVVAAQTAWASHERAAARRGVGVRFDGPARLDVAADGAILASLLDNLFGNAATYATPGSTIACAIVAGDAERGPRLSLTNAADNLEAADLARFDEPFWRKDAARTSGEHAGLGLSLVREYARAMRLGCRHAMPDAWHVTAELTWPPEPSPAPPDPTDCSAAPFAGSR